MPRRGQARVLTYDLSSAAAREAFEEELDYETEQNYQRISGGRGPRGRSNSQFSLRHDMPRAIIESSALEDLVEMFGGVAERTVIASVLEDCNYNFDRALEALLQITHQSAGVEAGSTATGREDGSVEQLGEFERTPAPGQCYWERLPEDIKAHILGLLNNRDLSRVAHTCMDFSQRAKSSRQTAKHINIPTGMRILGIVGMVGGHPNARSVSLKQWAHTPLQEDDFTALIVAISQGSHNAKRNTPVESISFKGCNWVTDGMVVQLCETMRHLKEVCLADCKGVTDMALTVLAKYRRAVPQQDDASSDDDASTHHLHASAQRRGVHVRPQGFGDDEDDGHDAEMAAAIAASLQASGAGGKGASASSGSGVASHGWHGGEMSPNVGFDSDSDNDDDDNERIAGGGDIGPASGMVGAEDVDEDVDGGCSDDGNGSDDEAGSGAGSLPGRLVGIRGTSRRTTADSTGAAPDTAAAAAVARGSTAATAAAPAAATPKGVSALSRQLAEMRVQGSSSSSSSKRPAGLPLTPASGKPPPAPISASPLTGGIAGSSAARPITALSQSPSSVTASGSLNRAGAWPVMGTSPGGAAGGQRTKSALYGSSPGGTAGASPSSGGGGLLLRYASPRASSGSMAAAGTSPTAGGSAGLLPNARYLYGASPPSASGVGSGALAMYGSSPVMGSSPFFRASGSATPNNFIARAVSAATSSENGRGLMSLNLSGCASISSDGVKALLNAPVAKACLLQLDVSRCPRITRAALVLPPTSNLCVLRASGCNNLHEVVMQLPLASPLTELALNDCKALSRLVVVAPALQTLQLNGCRHLSRLSVRCPRLRQLNTGLCFKLCELEAEAWDCPALERLNVFGCRHLMQPSLDMVLNGALKLKHLDANGCNMLVSLDLTGAELRSVEVSGCKALTSLRCSSLLLQQLTARACPKLTDIALDAHAATLTLLDISNCPALTGVTFPALQAVMLQLQAQQAQAPSPQLLQQQQHPHQAAWQGGAAAMASVWASRSPSSSTAGAAAAPWSAAAASPAAAGSGVVGSIAAAGASASSALSGASLAAASGHEVMVHMAGCDGLPHQVAYALRRMRAAARAAASRRQQATLQQQPGAPGMAPVAGA